MNNQIMIASIQMYSYGDQEKNLNAMEKHLNHINKAFPDVRMVIFPELVAHGAVASVSDEAEEIPGKLTDTFSGLAKKHSLWLIPGSIYESSEGNTFNTTPIFSPEGDMVEKYRKRYPWCPHEKTTPGDEPCVFSVDGVGVVGVMICYDMWFPEVARDLVGLGAELIVIPTMTTTGDRPQEKIIARSTAITQQCYVVSCNGVGYGGVGGSLIVDPEGVVLQESGEGPYMQTAIIDFERVRLIRERGVAGVTNPLRDFNQNKQTFSIYNEQGRKK
jgi:predicted amidohydrolase